MTCYECDCGDLDGDNTINAYDNDIDGDGKIMRTPHRDLPRNSRLVSMYLCLCLGIANSKDNCPCVSNANQADGDSDQIGDVCDKDSKRGLALLSISVPFSLHGGHPATRQLQLYQLP